MAVSNIFLAIAFVWILQLILSLLQTKRFHQKIAELRKLGTATSVGISGKSITLKNYAVLVVDDTRTIISAQKLSGFTVFANLKDVPGLQGISLDRFTSQTPIENIKPKLWRAFQNAADFITRHDEKQKTENEEQNSDKVLQNAKLSIK
ncbi:MAG: transcriptional regulator GutM [Salinispira sp.]